jgi:alpha-L-fucosidase 2
MRIVLIHCTNILSAIIPAYTSIVLYLSSSSFSRQSIHPNAVAIHDSRLTIHDNNYASTLWYDHPSINWNEALPIGNGRLGAMIYGTVSTEHIQLNEQTLWSGAPRNWNNPATKKYLPLVRKAALEKRYRQADSLSRFMQGPYTESYLPMADIFIHDLSIPDSTDYRRTLNLDSAISTVSFFNGRDHITRTAFASFPDQVIVMRHASSGRGGLSFRIMLSSKLHYTVSRVSSNHLVLKGKCPKHVEPVYQWKIKDAQAIQYGENAKGEGMTFELDLLVKNEGGTVMADDSGIIVTHADAATFIVSAATSFNGYDHSPGLQGKEPAICSLRDLEAARPKTFDQLLRRHVGDYQSYFRRVYINLGRSTQTDLPTDARLKRMASYTDPELVATIAQFGRYLLISGSRPGGLPVNLKGIWNDRVRPEYSSNWCIDHDAQMFYYAVETTNLSDMHRPFLDFIEGLAKNGAKTAAINYGMKGWCAHHNTDIWRQSGPVGNWGEGNPHWATWNMSGPWLSAHFFEHYLFTGDKKFLREKAWPIMRGAAEFCLDWLIDDGSSHLVSVPSVSPENTFITSTGDTAQISTNTTSDIALMRELFRNCLQTCQLLDTDKAFAVRIKTALGKLPSFPIGVNGNLLEWAEERTPVDPSHRHLSHLYPVFPGSEISLLTAPLLNTAAKKALSLREKTNCSWGFAWKAACWARLGEPDSAWQTWQYQLQYVDPRSTSSFNNYGLFPNLFNSDGRDVIMNGNGCATAVLTEMLLQSQTGIIQLLPSLPAVFPEGQVEGLCARGGFVIGMDWKQGRLQSAMVHSTLGNTCSIQAGGNLKVYDGALAVVVTRSGKDLISFPTKAGGEYTLVNE